MLSFLATAIALGIAGFDPLGSVVLIGALGLGVRRSGVAVLTLVSIGTSLILGLLGVVGAGALAHRLHLRHHPVPHEVWVVIALAVGVALVAWAVVRFVRGGALELDEGSSHRPRSASAAALAVSGLVVGLSSLADPAFWAMLVHASQLHHHRRLAPLEAAIWVLCSHSLLVVLAILDLVGGHVWVSRLVTDLQTRHGARIRTGLSALIAALGLLVLVDAGVALATGSWLVEI